MKMSTISTCKSMNKSQKHSIKWKKPNTEEHMVYDSIYINFKHRQNHFYSEKVKILFILDYLWGRQGGSDYKRASGVLCCCLVTESCSNLCDPRDCSPLCSFVPGSLQARILEWVAISFSKGFFWLDQTHVSCIGRQILYHWTTWEALAMFSILTWVMVILWSPESYIH